MAKYTVPSPHLPGVTIELEAESLVHRREVHVLTIVSGGFTKR